MDSYKQIYKYLFKQNNQVVELITRGQQLKQLEKALFPFLNQYVNTSWKLGNFNTYELTILISSALEANRLRLNVIKLLNEINKLDSFKTITNIKIKVSPEHFNPNKPIKLNLTKLKSKSGSEDLESLANMIDDNDLKSSIKRLASRLRGD